MAMKNIVEAADELKAAGKQLANQVDGYTFLDPMQRQFLKFLADLCGTAADKSVEISTALIKPEGEA